MDDVRYGWIEASLRYAGRFGPREKVSYQDLFQVSAPSVSRHQDAVARTLEEICGVQLFHRDANEHWLGGKLTLLPDARLPEKTVFSRVPSLGRWLQDAFEGVYFHNIEIQRSEPEPDIIRPIIRALEDRHTLEIQYRSRSGTSRREVSPHAIVKAAGRLHMRAWDHSKNEPRDFVLSRIQSVCLPHDGSTTYIDNTVDADWHNFVSVVIKERPSSDPNTTLGVRMDFSLDASGCRKMRVRKALAPYIVDIDGEEFSAPITIGVLPEG